MSLSENEASLSNTNHPEALALELTCPICLQLFSEPVSLPCGHIYCFGCLQTMGEGLDQHSCPECQTEYQGTKALVKNFKMRNIVETYKATAGKILSTADPSDVSHVAVEGNDSSPTAESNAKYPQSLATAGKSQEESSESKAQDGFQMGSGSTNHPFSVDQEKSSCKGKLEMDEPKFKLASQVTELNLKLEVAEGFLKKEKEWELEVTTANAQLREKASKLLGQIQDLSQSYSVQVTQMIEEELGPGEASVFSRVSQASELTKQLRQATFKAESLLTEDDETVFSDELKSLQPHIEELIAKPVEEEDLVEVKVNPARVCSKLENMNAELRDRLGEIQRSLRSTLNPSEVTFDPETVHPNLILSEDLKTVTFSAVKQTYPSSPQRFMSFFQVLSTQSFSEGDHCWEVELEGSPWIIGICYSGKLERSGLPSALESSRGSWCLMWFNNLLTAFEQSHSVPLKKTTVSRRLEVRLSFKTHRLSFYNISATSGKTHIYTFKANLTEPVHLAYRMMSGHPKGRVTVHS
ncbi:E3 ubiquitin-protein ligase TRIM21 [Stegastes partitus]|uniref:E3 ubiquitin-protein ligase TRIM21-like n=1 Tax=Stegastes partitus TaxID=144197 RepID=A0A3B5AYJ8_9TELE|nr:PREDICTED: E3 ubiquitin-protein ligase TRIM21-like [Stegastes partitus]